MVMVTTQLSSTVSCSLLLKSKHAINQGNIVGREEVLNKKKVK